LDVEQLLDIINEESKENCKVRNNYYVGGEPRQFSFVFPIMRIIGIIKIISCDIYPI